MNYTVYKITHKSSGKIYVGVHQTTDLDDGYFGSGKYLGYAVAKHGVDDFEKEILHVFDNAEEMFTKEAEIVTEEFIARDDTYNLKVGGFGGWDYVNANRTTEEIVKFASLGGLSKGTKYSAELSRKRLNLRWADEDYRKKMLDVLSSNFSGKKHTQETKDKIGKANSKHQSGKGNSQYGTCWVYSEKEKCSKRIKKSELLNYLNADWSKGRKMKF